MSSPLIPEAAVEAAARSIYGDDDGWRLGRRPKLAEHALEAALPHLRAAWEAELLSDDAIERAAAEIRPKINLGERALKLWRGYAERALRAALGLSEEKS